MRAYKISIDYTDQATVPEEFNRPPKRSVATTWLKSNAGLFRVHLTVVGPKRQESERYLPLPGGKADRVGQAIADLVKTLEEEAGIEHPAGT